MLELSLSLEGASVLVKVGGKRSHEFALDSLTLTRQQVETFPDDPSDYGGRLYAALFPAMTPAWEALQALPLAPGAGSRFVLRLEHPMLNGIPWEYLFDGRRYLATEYGFARCSVPRSGSVPLNVPDRLVVLFVPSDPLVHHGQVQPHYLGVDKEWDELLEILRQTDPAVDLVKVLPPTVDALQASIAGVSGAIVHFTGHGRAEGNRAYLHFEQKSGASDAVDSVSVASLLRGRAA
ncbi:MAG: CHAT domain-containing protein, partial [Candidatus Oleimicrobiaceae bacterium]